MLPSTHPTAKAAERAHQTCDPKKPTEEGAGKEDDDESSGYSSADSESDWFPKLDGSMPPRLTGMPDNFSPGLGRV